MTDEFEADAVVVGGGASGLSAASEAARRGRKVILLEKNPELGGSSAWAVGSISATGTPHQRRAGIKDSPQEHFEDLEILAGRFGNRDNRELRRLLVDGIPDVMDWLMSIGIEFVGPMQEPPHRHDRMHNVIPNAKAFAYHLGRHCRKLGVDIRLNTIVDDLVDTNGRITGVTARCGERTQIFRASGGVILSAGDYSGSRELKAELASPDVVDVDPVNPTATGDGFRIGMRHGGVVVNGDIVRGPIMRFVPPRRRSLLQVIPPVKALTRAMRWSFEHVPAAILRPFVMSFLTTAVSPSAELFQNGAILVNANAERFGDELSQPGHATARQPDRLAHIVFDETVASQFSRWPNYISTAPGIAYAYLDDYRRSRADIFHKADTVDGLAERLKVPADRLAATIAAYNARTDGISRTESAFRPLVASPFYALGPVRSHVVFTDGGLKVTTDMQVVTARGTVKPGLYAAGSNGQGGVLLEGHGHHLGWAFVSGRIAGRNAALRG